ncbi:hypothetical protein ACTFIR_003546 [Dictyostelium discoideum]
MLDLKEKKCHLPVGNTEPVVSDFPLGKTYNTIVLSSLNDGQCPIYWDIFDTTNDSDNFLHFLSRCIVEDILCDGDVLIMDNAKVHSPENIYRLCSEHGIIIKFMPKYCPELNPTEQVHNMVKNLIKNNQVMGPLKECIERAHEQITKKLVYSFYKYCFFSKFWD